jgi:uncharacterized membrane protein YesL
MRGFYTAYISIGNMVYMAFVVNLLLTIANLPLIFLFVATDVRTTWLLILMLVPILAISLAAVFSVFERFSADGSVEVAHEFVRGWARYVRPAGATGAIVSIGIFVLAVDVIAVWGSPYGAAAIPLFVTLMALFVSTALHVLAGIVGGVEAVSPLAIWKACFYFSVRRWYLTVMSMVVLSILVSLTYAMPAWGAGLAASPILYVAWTNSRQALLPIAPTTAREAVNA